jgi:hypothetical protein
MGRKPLGRASAILDRLSGILSAVNHPPILLGTSSFTATGWQGSFYPKGMRSADYLAFYAEHFTYRSGLDVLCVSFCTHG